MSANEQRQYSILTLAQIWEHKCNLSTNATTRLESLQVSAAACKTRSRFYTPPRRRRSLVGSGDGRTRPLELL